MNRAVASADDDDHDVLLLLDACTLINLFASRRERDILGAQGQAVGIVNVVRRETAFVFRGGDGDDAREREPINLEPAIDAYLLHVITPTDAELDDFVDLTLRFKGDGEAMTIAIALARGWTIVTNDRKAIRLIANRIPVRSSLALIRTWSIKSGIDPESLRTVLRDIRTRGNYAPSIGHPLKDWWDGAAGDR